jgi:large subunit ribosomal protein L43
MSSSSRLIAPLTKPIFRAQLGSKPSNGHTAFVPQIRKLVFEYSQNWSSSANTRTYLKNNLQSLARANPHIEVVVRQRSNRQPIVRGLYRTSWHPPFFIPS